MGFVLGAAGRRSVLDFVRPLSVGLDGVTNFGFMERRLRWVEALADRARAGDPEAAIHESRLFLLGAFAGLPARRISPGGRTDLLLASAGVPPEGVRRLFQSLRRFESWPATLEERLVRDAGLLETVGAYGVTQLLVWGTRERMTLVEMAEEIERRMANVSFATDSARALVSDRISFARSFAERLRAEVAEFEPTS